MDDRQALTTMANAAKATGLTAHIEGPSVDLHAHDTRGQPVAAIRMHLRRIHGDTRWMYEFPARPPHTRAAPFLTGFGPAHQPVTPEDLADLDRWWARHPATGRTWHPTTMPWQTRWYRND